MGLSRQANRALPDLVPKARSEIIWDQFIEGIQDSYIQESLLQDGPDTLEEAIKTARKLGAASVYSAKSENYLHGRTKSSKCSLGQF